MIEIWLFDCFDFCVIKRYLYGIMFVVECNVCCWLCNDVIMYNFFFVFDYYLILCFRYLVFMVKILYLICGDVVFCGFVDYGRNCYYCRNGYFENWVNFDSCLYLKYDSEELNYDWLEFYRFCCFVCLFICVFDCLK